MTRTVTHSTKALKVLAGLRCRWRCSIRRLIQQSRRSRLGNRRLCLVAPSHTLLWNELLAWLRPAVCKGHAGPSPKLRARASGSNNLFDAGQALLGADVPIAPSAVSDTAKPPAR